MSWRFMLLCMSILTLPLVSDVAIAKIVCPVRTERAISYIREARETHRAWLRYIEAGKATPVEIKIAGDTRSHQQWIARYSFTLRVLRGNCQ